MSPPALRAHLLAYARPRLGALRRRVSPEELADVVDLALAARVGRAFVVSVTHGAVAAAVATDPGRYWTTPLAGTRAADAAGGAALAWLGEETGEGGEDGAAGGAHVREAALVLKEGR